MCDSEPPRMLLHASMPHGTLQSTTVIASDMGQADELRVVLPLTASATIARARDTTPSCRRRRAGREHAGRESQGIHMLSYIATAMETVVASHCALANPRWLVSP